MKAGFGRKEITPAYSTAMAGFDRRTAPSEGTLDPLYVSVLALVDDGGEPFLFCSFDLLGVERVLCDTIRQGISGRLGISREWIWVSATHTHSAPSSVFAYSKHYREDYVNDLLQKSICAASQAMDSLQNVRMSAGYTGISGIASRRNQGRAGAGFAMPLLKVRFASAEGAVTLCAMACHPTILDEKNILFSRDLPGAAAAASPDGERIIFLNGACGDLSTRFTRSASSPEELSRLGRLLAEGLENMPMQDIQSCGKILATRQQLTLSRGAGPGGAQRKELMEALRELIAQCKDPQMLREYDSRLAVLERQNVAAEPARLVEICAVNLGQFAFLGLPFEVDSADGAVLEQTLSEVMGKPVYVQCYTGGYDGYLPSGAPLSINSSYEDIASRYMPEAREQVLECAKQCVLKIMD